MRVADDPDKIQFQISNATDPYILDYPVSKNEWHHAVGVRKGTDIFLYLDGVLVNSTTLSSVYNVDSNYNSPSIGEMPLAIGVLDRPVGASDAEFFNGSIDEVRIWNRSLSEEEVKQHYYSNLRTYDTDKWEFYTNQSNLTDGIYTYQGFVRDRAGNSNSTGVRYLTIGEITGFYCTVRLGSCNVDEVNLFQMASISGGHASVDDSYSYKVCCGGIEGLGKECSGNHDVVMRLQQEYNSHVEASAGTGNIDVCLSSTGSMNCQSYEGECSELGDYGCVASIYSYSNAHVGDCNAYNMKICCHAHWRALDHPLANFVAHHIEMLIGDSVLLRVQVRNIKMRFDNITLNLSEYDFASFIDTGEGELSFDKRCLWIGLNPYEEKELFVRVFSSSIDQFYIQLNATSSLTEDGELCGVLDCVLDSDIVTITMGYPPQFPGLNVWGILLLITVSLIVYSRVERRKQIAI